ncbi:GntR family transcriptional regulator [Rathayibacter sp. VKM Ac-2754]|uniref:GntR family transcriptional regulator n=1 Tax=Rathayibacter sp. VKM Ac-2754 TaxID=2609251 RepID=UPI001358CBDF|nr:GntR family transcriptional regulator [Rathayibacter sp. VKM Ac-2754]MWV58935.1 GntR family transcriptional regulator [Rathayibacter sp. VKM Ac-2754]
MPTQPISGDTDTASPAAVLDQRRAAYLAMRRARPAEGSLPQTSPRRVYTLLRAAIRNGDLPADSRLDEGRLGREFATSRNAVRLALQQLDVDGLVTRVPGRGTVVIAPILAFPVFECVGPSLGLSGELRLVESREVTTNPYLARRLGGRNPTVHMSEFLVEIDGVVVGIFSRYGHQRAEALEHDRPVLGSADVSWYRRIHAEAPGDIRVVIDATGADDRTARVLGVDIGHPLLVRETVYFDAQHAPAEFHITYLDSRKASLSAAVSGGELLHTQA